MSHMVFEETACPVCSEKFQKIKDDEFFRVCFTCRTDFGCTTLEHVNELLEWFKEIKPEERAAFTVGRNRHHHRGNGGHQGHTGTGHVMRPVLDLVKVAAGVRALTAYGLTLPLAEPLSLPTNYVIAQNGLFEVRHTDVADICLALSPPSTSIMGITEKLTQGVMLNVPKVPFEMLAQTVTFFRGVMKRFNNAEAIVRIWWNTAERRYEIRVPDGGQRVSGARVDHQDDFDLAGERDASGAIKYLHVMDIHSHNNMSGFWSGTDDADERKAPEGRMFGVLGKATQTIPDWKWRMRSREGFIDLLVTDIFTIPDVKIDYTSSMRLSELMITPVVTATLTCGHDPFADATCPEEWYRTVNQPTAQQHTGNRFTSLRSWAHGHTGATERASAGVIVPSFIFAQVDDGHDKFLEEFEVLGDKVKPTGAKYKVENGTIVPRLADKQ